MEHRFRKGTRIGVGPRTLLGLDTLNPSARLRYRWRSVVPDKVCRYCGYRPCRYEYRN
jgi:hypothetical protein